ncbi:DUF4445 domain-containing protein [Desulfobulbus rhabdoformis]|uniref:ASKHA domain-containing protein n=1 Tax=Desulfobulbus rhabdoformis TaxID=34032 RepID=UPI0019667F2B|nr:ASKHA domain-containing protein [Desulfobulbus rhabdoformis]MBM9615893.1 DUF4445 domain-containing protein [Desulfobulbus rhabdoformis]
MSNSCRLTVHPSKTSVVVEAGTTVLQAVQQIGALVRSDCGGAGVCGKCLVRAEEGNGLSPLTEAERQLLGDEQVTEGGRLACLATLSGEAAVHVEPAEDAGTSPRGKDIQAPECSCDPTVRRVFISPVQLPDAVSSVEPIVGFLAEQLGHWPDFLEFDLGQQLEPLLENSSFTEGITLICHRHHGVSAVLPGKQLASLGLAVDLGTTTIAAYLCDLQSGTLLASAAMFNPQRTFGDDVISRISSAVESEAKLAQMQGTVAAGLEQLARKCLADSGRSAGELDELVVAGNTTMQTIFAGDSPESLGRAPYQPNTHEARNIWADELNISLGVKANVYIYPVISGFLGGDSVAAALGGRLHQVATPTLIIDIGTNGELLLGCGDRIVATSCATGPALEGAVISCGMRAVAGAIDAVSVDTQANCLRYHHLGVEEGARPQGLCGSGLIDVIACMRQLGIIEESGRLNADAPGVVCDDQGFGHAYTMIPAADSGTGKDIRLTLMDIRAFQLAKSALVVGIEKLVEQYGLDEVPRTCITGAFGAHFNWHNGLLVDLLSPKVTAGEISSGANLAGAGAMLVLLNQEKRKEAEQLAAACTAVELASDPEFNLRFVERTRFPALQN